MLGRVLKQAQSPLYTAIRFSPSLSPLRFTACAVSKPLSSAFLSTKASAVRQTGTANEDELAAREKSKQAVKLAISAEELLLREKAARKTSSKARVAKTEVAEPATITTTTTTTVAPVATKVVTKQTIETFDQVSNQDATLSTVDFLQKHQIKLQGEGVEKFSPLVDFSSVPFDSKLIKVLKSEGYVAPTATQAQSWPIVLGQRDVISVARTGSGKTCGFLLPAFQKLILDRQSNPQDDRVKPFSRTSQRGSRKPTSFGRLPQVLVLAPTRELAVQISDEADKYARSSGFVTSTLYGGAPKGGQIQTIKNGVDVVVATPGRCNDLLEMGVLNLSKVSYFVLDEADRMLDMGFEPQIRQIVERLPEKRQSLFFTATWPREVQGLARDFLNNPVQINIGDSSGLNANKAITQNVILVDDHAKWDCLLSTLKTINANENNNRLETFPKTLIFVSRKSACEDLADQLSNLGYPVDTLHGDMSQMMRTRAMDRFRRGYLRVLVATDVAARGLDVQDIENVINYDFPVGSSGVEDYVHRIGRTARGERKGTAYTFFSPRNDRDRAEELVDVLKRSEQVIPEGLVKLVNPRKGRGFGDSGFRGRSGFSRHGGWGGRGGMGGGRGSWGGGNSDGGAFRRSGERERFGSGFRNSSSRDFDRGGRERGERERAFFGDRGHDSSSTSSSSSSSSYSSPWSSNSTSPKFRGDRGDRNF